MAAKTSRKDYVKVASILAELRRDGADVSKATDRFVDWFASDNPRFDEARFRAATEEE